MSARESRSRREFLATAATGAAAAGLAGLGGRSAAASESASAPHRTEGVITRQLGRTGITLPVVSMGVMNTDDANLLRRSYEMGVRHFDTAAVYMGGRNEEVVGATIRDMGIRDEVTLATKILHTRYRRGLSGNALRDAIIEHTDQSLQRLGMDHVELLYLHVVQDEETATDPAVLEGMERIKEQGKARFTGFSTHRNMATCIRAATANGGVDVILSSFNYAYSEKSDLIAAMQAAAGAGIGIVAMKTQCVGAMTRGNVPAEGQAAYPDEVMHNAVLRWAIRPEFISTSIPGYTTFQQLEQNWNVVSSLEFSEQEQAFLDDHRTRTELGFCLQCEECAPTCARNADIPTLMRAHMYATAYTNFEQAREALVDIEYGRGMENCTSCAECTARCANTVDIASRIAELQTIYA